MSFDVVRWDAATFAIHVPEGDLGEVVTLLGGQAVPPNGLSGVLRSVLIGAVPDPEVDTCAWTSPGSAQARRSARSCVDGLSCAWTGGPSTKNLRAATATVMRTAWRCRRLLSQQEVGQRLAAAAAQRRGKIVVGGRWHRKDVFLL